MYFLELMGEDELLLMSKVVAPFLYSFLEWSTDICHWKQNQLHVFVTSVAAKYADIFCSQYLGT